MDISLDRKTCSMIDKGIAGKFEQMSIMLKDSGLYVQAVDKPKSMVIDHYVDRILLEPYVVEEVVGTTIPYTKFLLNGMERLAILRKGSLLKMTWSGEGVFLEKHLYTLDFEWVEVEYNLGTVMFSLPYTGLSLIRRIGGNELEVHVSENKMEIRAISENNVILYTNLDTPVSAACSFTLLKYHLDRLPKCAYSSAAFNIDKQGLVILSLEALGVITTVTIATEVLFFD
ncbi:hypothetical protein NEAUS04_0495 [Nematocida ausubeli]|uniref:Uncharacterized protein n=1 Tax=Nematocida ausubeli (strain ATCC PRA-371 / ERTm2) TaxID=1913371 RepID=H8ZDR7_NEMA1|nr:uncharacterized protein NESG_00160 [Nematocida ausubeli]EHY65292.1 hypothetical protein NERG_01738 [Nematocida ausubeli]KAI5135115.1 hypothetical protein NEAUS07_0998 [Nematocida ausubeli]KAI5137227.1 hypothetical protein NEAUS06_2152 [Nematocida ausubeli]KAI5147393.1 hypothetical protein NEAUS05_0702 [Nematocida ausubeli]KAI5161395.1 hypothetical protein NEAUS04_0495 [Nematocida ausubeli]